MSYVNVEDFIYKGKRQVNVLDGDSFCYCPCDIYGTPKLYYGDCHYSCAGQAFDDILNSFNAGDMYNWFDDSEIDSITEDIWLDSDERGRLFFGKYLAVGEDGHIPSVEYVSDVLKYLGGSPENYSVVFNKDNKVVEMPFDVFLQRNIGNNGEIKKLAVPNAFKEVYNKINSRRAVVNRKFPNNMTRAEYYSYKYQESKNRNKNTIRLTEQQLHKIIKESVQKVLIEIQKGGV